MELDNHTKRLIAIGASVTANCQPCLQINVTNALAEGLSAVEIDEAIEVGRLVRQGAATKMDKYAPTLTQSFPQVAVPSDGGCKCV